MGNKTRKKITWPEGERATGSERGSRGLVLRRVKSHSVQGPGNETWRRQYLTWALKDWGWKIQSASICLQRRVSVGPWRKVGLERGRTFVAADRDGENLVCFRSSPGNDSIRYVLPRLEGGSGYKE